MEIASAVFNLASKRLHRACSTTDGRVHYTTSFTVRPSFSSRFSGQRSRLVWTCIVDGMYSARSCYMASFHGSIRSDSSWPGRHGCRAKSSSIFASELRPMLDSRPPRTT
jgi:hypothetical protein